MAFLDIEKVINREGIGSRFKLVHITGLRAKELNKPREDTALQEMKEGEKVTSKALTDIAQKRVTFTEILLVKPEDAEVIVETTEPTAKKNENEKG